MRGYGFIFLIGFLFSGYQATQGQETFRDTVKASLLIIDFAKRINTIEKDTVVVQILTGNVQMHQDSIFMYCDSAHKAGNLMTAVGNVLIQQWDSVFAFADTLFYNSTLRRAELKGGVALQSGTQKVFTEYLVYDLRNRVAHYSTGGKLSNDTTILYSKRGTFYIRQDEAFFKDSVFIQGKEFNLFSDTLKFDTDKQIAHFLGPTRINLENQGRIYCESGFYDIPNDNALFTTNAQYTKESQRAVADRIRYVGDEERVYLAGNALLTEEDRIGRADSIIYEESSEQMTLIGNAFFEDSLRQVYSEVLKYDEKNKKVSSNRRTRLIEPPQFMEADSLVFYNELGEGFASGNIMWVDTTESHSIHCEYANYRDSLSYIKAFGSRPLFMDILDEDTLFLSADTLISFFETDSSRLFLAFNRVGIFKSDFQATCDSLAYNESDSTFRLYNQPIIWSDTTQLTSDSMEIKMVNNDIDRIYLKQNAFLINSPDEILFNQMKGRIITAFFEEGELFRMLITGNAESLYYALDEEDAYIGVNKTLCSKMMVFLEKNAVTEIVFFDNPQAKFHPIQKARHDELQLEGFNWRSEIRPQSVSDIRK